ncbi:MAG: Ig-like domain-containing protein, partial [Planctomycetes bacterium]|nr:Ig-like domain-containing protein [Planctomycetota bacterium]
GTFQVESLALAEGDNVLRARAEDLAGNATEVERTVVLDTRAPEVTITDPAPGTVTGEASYTFSGTVADPHLDRVEVAGQAATLTGDRWSISVPLTEGDNEIVVEAFDTLGHRGTASVDVEFQSDAPSVHIDEPTEGFVTSSSPIDVSGTVDAGATVTVNGEAAVVTDGTFTATGLALLEGQNRLLARATDAEGREGVHTRVVVLDTLAPVTASSQPADGGSAIALMSSFLVTFSEPMAEPAAGALTLRTAAGAAITATVTVEASVIRLQPQSSLPSATDIELELTAGLTDLAGNALADPQILTFTTDESSGAPGAPSINPLPPFYLCANSWTLTGTTVPRALVRAEGGASTAEARADENGAFSLEIALAPGRLHRLSVTATDLDRQVSPAAEVEIVHDCAAPTVLFGERQGNDFVA